MWLYFKEKRILEANFSAEYLSVSVGEAKLDVFGTLSPIAIDGHLANRFITLSELRSVKSEISLPSRNSPRLPTNLWTSIAKQMKQSNNNKESNVR